MHTKDKAVILSKGCTLESQGELKKKILMPGSTPRAPAIIALGMVWASRVFKASQVIRLCGQGDEPHITDGFMKCLFTL